MTSHHASDITFILKRARAARARAMARAKELELGLGPGLAYGDSPHTNMNM